MAGKIVKTLEISGVLTSFEIIEGVPDFGESREMIPVTTLSDTDTSRERPHPLKEFKPVTFKVSDKGTRPTSSATAATVTITAKDPAGTTIAARSYKAILSGIAPETVAVEGNRVPAYSVTISPTGAAV
jgi:hypothetical protein